MDASKRHNEISRDLLMRIAELEAALSHLVDHFLAMAGPKAHRLGCDCGGSNDGIHSCTSLRRAIDAATEALSR